nr:hypothetical protein [uncultured Flavobacterium sp.]
MKTLKSKVGKWIFRILILFILIFLFIAYNLRLMEVEDRYGDLQEIYWKTENNDIAFNKLNKTSAFIEKDWKRMYVKINGKLIDIDEWLDPNNKYDFNVAIYRPNRNWKKPKKLNRVEIENGIRNSSLELITELKFKY